MRSQRTGEGNKFWGGENLGGEGIWVGGDLGGGGIGGFWGAGGAGGAEGAGAYFPFCGFALFPFPLGW